VELVPKAYSVNWFVSWLNWEFGGLFSQLSYWLTDRRFSHQLGLPDKWHFSGAPAAFVEWSSTCETLRQIHCGGSELLINKHAAGFNSRSIFWLSFDTSPFRFEIRGVW